jgi:SH3-like domain-containing protein
MKKMKMIKKTSTFLMLISIFATMFPLTASANRIIAWGAANAVGNGVRIRSGPSLEHAIIRLVDRNEVVVILELTDSEWYKVSFHGTIGYISVPLLVNPRQVVEFDAVGSIIGNNVKLRDLPSTSGTILASHNIGTLMNITGINNGWYSVEYDEYVGYVRSDLIQIQPRDTDVIPSDTETPEPMVSEPETASETVTLEPVIPEPVSPELEIPELVTSEPVDSELLTSKLVAVELLTSELVAVELVIPEPVTPEPETLELETPEPETPEPVTPEPVTPEPVTPEPVTLNSNHSLGQQIADHAMSFTGTRYVWGGASPNGFDCSGFVSYVLSNFDIRVTRTASGQYRDNGVKIQKSELLPGDLVFTSSNGTSVTHVGIYIGGAMFVHASSARSSVVITDLNCAYYINAYFGAKRVAQ